MGEQSPRDVVSFWIDEVGPEGWYKQSDELDARIRDRFLPSWEAAFGGEMHHWCESAEDIFGLIILADQFPRNMFRGDERSFATDPLARTASKLSIDRRWDLKVEEPERQFMYMPLMHSEALNDQDLCIRLMTDRMPETGADNLLHARAHREVIRRFGRFPFRNAALRRKTLPAEQTFLDEGGYGAIVEALKT